LSQGLIAETAARSVGDSHFSCFDLSTDDDNDDDDDDDVCCVYLQCNAIQEYSCSAAREAESFDEVSNQIFQYLSRSAR